MKRLLVLLVTLLVSIPLALGAMAGLSYYTTSTDTIPEPVISAMDTPIRPTGYEWRQPVFGGLIYRDFSCPVEEEPLDLGQLTEPVFPLITPDGYETRATILSGDEIVWSGRSTELQGYQFLNNGRYRMLVECQRNSENGKGSGAVFYNLSFTVKVEPRYEISDDWIDQGEVMAVRVFNLTDGMTPTGASNFCNLNFVPAGKEGQMIAYLPVAYNQEVGAYTMEVSVGSQRWSIPFRVTQRVFELRTVAKNGQPEPSKVFDPLYYKEYADEVSPLLAEYDTEKHWNGMFIEPVHGQVLTPYGLYLSSNGKDVMARHPGIDYKANEETSVYAPNSGRVVFAGELPTAGNTVIIEHGGGLKSIFQHLDRIDVKVDEMVEKGAAIATVGQTGDANLPHLHYEVRLGGVAINPASLLNTASGLYRFE